MARIDEYMETCLEARRQRGLTAVSEAAFRDAWETYRQVPGSFRPTADTVRRYRAWQASLDPDAAHRRLRLLLALLADLMELRAIPAFRLPPRPTPQRVEGRTPMSEAQVQALVLAIDGLGLQTLAALVYFTGLRAERLLTLGPEHVLTAGLQLPVPGSRHPSFVPLGPDAADVIVEWGRRRQKEATTFLHDNHGQPLQLRTSSMVLRAAGAQVGLPAVGFGHLQYAHLPLLAASVPMFTRDLLETRLQQPFRLRYLHIPNLFNARPDPDLTRPYITPLEHLLKDNHR